MKIDIDAVRDLSRKIAPIAVLLGYGAGCVSLITPIDELGMAIGLDRTSVGLTFIMASACGIYPLYGLVAGLDRVLKRIGRGDDTAAFVREDRHSAGTAAGRDIVSADDTSVTVAHAPQIDRSSAGRSLDL